MSALDLAALKRLAEVASGPSANWHSVDTLASALRPEVVLQLIERLELAELLANYATHEDSCEFHADLRCSCGYYELVNRGTP